MKKLFIIFTLALSAITMTAQIEFVAEIPININHRHSLNPYDQLFYNDYFLPSNYFCTIDTSLTGFDIDIYSLITASKIKTVSIPRKINEKASFRGGIYDNLWTNDGKICFMLDYDNKQIVYNEDGDSIAVFKCASYIIEGDSDYFLFDYDVSSISFLIYKMPKQSCETNLNYNLAIRKEPTVRKVIENGQMYIILEGVKYAITGIEK